MEGEIDDTVTEIQGRLEQEDKMGRREEGVMGGTWGGTANSKGYLRVIWKPSTVKPSQNIHIYVRNLYGVTK